MKLYTRKRTDLVINKKAFDAAYMAPRNDSVLKLVIFDFMDVGKAFAIELS